MRLTRGGKREFQVLDERQEREVEATLNKLRAGDLSFDDEPAPEVAKPEAAKPEPKKAEPKKAEPKKAAPRKSSSKSKAKE